MEKIELVQLVDDVNNYKLLHKWCSHKSVYEWFEQRELTYDEIVKKYRNKLLNCKQLLYIIKYDNVPIGLVQIYKYDGEVYLELREYSNIYEFDIFIGEENLLSNGIGTEIVSYVTNFIYSNYLADCIILRPFKRNERAVKCYEKNGFIKIHEYIGTNTIGNEEIILVLAENKIEL